MASNHNSKLEAFGNLRIVHVYGIKIVTNKQIVVGIWQKVSQQQPTMLNFKIDQRNILELLARDLQLMRSRTHIIPNFCSDLKPE